VPEPKTYAYDESSNSQQGGNSVENSEDNVNRIANGLIGALITNTKNCEYCSSKISEGYDENCNKTMSGNSGLALFCSPGCCQKYYGY
jgi:hypothetical protein